MLRRQQRKIAIALLMLNVSGARAVVVSDSCQRCRTFYSSSLGFKAIAKTIARKEWKKTSNETRFGESHKHSHTRDLEATSRKLSVALVPVLPAVTVALESESPRAGPPGSALPADFHQVQPPHRLI